MTSLNPLYCMMEESIVIMLIVTSIAVGTMGSSSNPIWTTCVKDLCDMTPHPNACYNIFASMPFIRSITQPYPSQLLYKISLQATINEVSKVLNEFVQGNGTLIDNSNATSSALKTCDQVLSLALENLNSSLPAKDVDAPMNLDDLRTWLSAAETDLQTCMDGFDDATPMIRSKMGEKLNDSNILVSITLAIICEMDDHYVARALRTGSERNVEGMKQMERPDVVVAKDGSGNYSTINAALKAVPDNSLKRFVIHVKKGVYNEIVHVGMSKWNVMMFGDGMSNTIVSGDLTTASGKTTFETATFAAFGKGFVARDMGFENTARGRYQAVALLSTSDRSVFYRCRIASHQDTLYVHSNRQFYRECDIYGTVDFMFGNAAVVIQNSNIRPRKPIDGNLNTITAQGKSNPNSNTGMSIQNCVISAGEDLSGVRTYFGRPWRDYSTTGIMESQLESLIDPAGWRAWKEPVPDTIHFVEYKNRGAGARVTDRVKWKGLSAQNSTREQANKFTVRALIQGDQWLSATGVPFQLDL